MHILLTTYGLILIFILFATAQSRTTIDLAVLDIVASESFKNVRDDMMTTITTKSKNYYKKLCPKEQKEPKAKKEPQKAPQKQPVVEEEPDEDDEENGEELVLETLEIDQTELPECKRRTRFLHVDALFNQEEPNIHEGKGKACYTLLKNLINELYKDQEFYEAARDYQPDIDEVLLQSLVEQARQLQESDQHMPTIKVLCNLDLEDEFLSYVRSKMFTGTKSRKTPSRTSSKNSTTGYYPLHELICLRKNAKLMSIWLAPRPLLTALFEEEKIVDEVIAWRAEMYSELVRDRSPEADNNKSELEIKGNELKRRFSTYIRGIDPEFIDFQVSRTRPID